ncbi:biosynthetic-type acetolactate synthase large subunit [Gracilibacillus dipsosauri]|uniref:Acetolactate synthase n=1 Tax=Gracilibacillus dipsosauri TaxID=178340 RepID=A0A317KY21_9BACI|nr:biosynthetic-type acetolactate synthase large subunit [Gracilibacillus dipsosauri]PWU67630.1 biosynthetic-type acetolactate synthase large subunit [Gracilibacillus dipsosauri]
MQRVEERQYQKWEELFIQSLEKQHVDTIFGSRSHPMFTSNKKDFTQYLLTHEQAILHAGDGYARATGKVGIAFIPTKYGITNAVTGIATAQLDSVPMVVFIQQEHALDVEAIMNPICKHYFKLQQLTELPPIVEKACTLANAGRPGVVIVEYDNKLFQREWKENGAIKQMHIIPPKSLTIQNHQIKRIVEEIKKAKKPVLLVGGGTIISGASKALNEFLTLTEIPFVSTLMGLGAIDVGNRLHLGMVGMHGTFAANKAVHQCDLLICLGVRFSDRITGKTKGFSPHSTKIQIEIDPVEVNKNIMVDLPIIGDVKEVLEAVNQQLSTLKAGHWQEEVVTWKKTSPQFSYSTSELKPDSIIQCLYKNAEDHVIVTTDVGQHQMWTALHFPFQQPRHFLTSGGFGTMGYGLPAAIGAAVCQPNQPVVCVSGDGSIQMNIQELLTVAKYRLNIKIAILRNGYLGMVRQWQQLFYKHKYSQVKIASPDFLLLAKSFGIKAFQITAKDNLEKIMEEAFQIDGPVLLDFLIEEEVNVYPIVPPGGNNTDAISGE